MNLSLLSIDDFWNKIFFLVVTKIPTFLNEIFHREEPLVVKFLFH